MVENSKKLKRLLNRFRKKLGLLSWSIEVVVVENKRCLAKNKDLMFRSTPTLAEAIAVDSRKRKFTIYITKKAIAAQDLDDTILHELLHVLFWNMIEMAYESGADPDNRTLQRKIADEEHFVIEKIITSLL